MYTKKIPIHHIVLLFVGNVVCVQKRQTPQDNRKTNFYSELLKTVLGIYLRIST